MHANWFRPGGVHQDVPPQLLADIGAWLDQSEKIFEDAIRIVADNRIFKLRNVDISPVGKDDAMVLNFAGYSAIERSEEHTSELQSLMRISYAVFCLKKKNITKRHVKTDQIYYPITTLYAIC